MDTELQGFFQNLDEDTTDVFSQIADCAINLGYKPKRAKTKEISYVFTNNKVKKHILKFAMDKYGTPSVNLKFYASKNYPTLFHEAIRKTIEEFNFKYVGCYGCGKCDGTVGYTYTYPDGRTYFRCNGELIDLGQVTKADVDDVISLLNAQHAYYLAKI